MNKLILAALISLASVQPALAQTPAAADKKTAAPPVAMEAKKADAGSCESRAAEKKLAGAAKTSFMKKCEADATGEATTPCAAKATEKKLAGAAKTSFMKKCEADAKGADTKPAEAKPAAAKPAEKK